MIRAFQWDLARQVERLDWLLSKLPLYAEWGYQQLYLHLEDAIEYPSLPGIARSDAYRFREIEKLTAEAAKYGIGVVPIVNLLGHTQYLVKTERFRDLNELRKPDGSPCETGQICPSHPETPRIAEALIQDILPLCTAGMVHVGLDESFLLGRHPLSARDVAKVGLEAHFANHATMLERLAAGKGLRLGMWADMLALMPAAIPLLPRGIAAYDWYYYPFERHPRMELWNFAEYDLSPALSRQGISYWGCASNGAFRHEPLPVFGERLANLRSWWDRCRRVGAEGFLSASWESYRLAQEMTTVVDAAAASLWLDPEIDDTVEMLARGFRRVFGGRRSHEMARLALACDERAFVGYARWEINERWDICHPRDGAGRHERDARFFERSADRNLPEPFSASLRFRHYLARRDAFVRRAAAAVRELRRLLSRDMSARYTGGAGPLFKARLRRLRADIETFDRQLDAGIDAARAMWALSRNPKRRSQNEVILRADRRRLARLRHWLAGVERRPLRARSASPVVGAWQLDFVVHNFAPALQRVVVEQRDASGKWLELRGRYTIEFRAMAARPRTRIQRTFSVPVDPGAAGCGGVRLSLRGLGQVAISHVELSDGVAVVHPRHWPQREHRVLGTPSVRRFPLIDMTRNQEDVVLEFDPGRITRRPAGKHGSDDVSVRAPGRT